MKRLLAVLAVAIAAVSTMFGQPSQVIKPAVKAPTAQAPATMSQTQLKKLERLTEIQQWVASMRDETLSATTTAQLADAAWPVDEEYARGLFRTALSKVALGQNDVAKLIAAKNAANRRIMSLIARRDLAWAKTLVQASTKNAVQRGSTQLEIANDLLETDPERAAELAAQAAQSEMNQGRVGFLNALRRQNLARADQMFGQLITSFLSQPNLTAHDYALLGTYVFRSRFADLEDGTIVMQRIGNVMLPDLTGDRPGATPALIGSYLRGLVTLLGRPAIDPNQRPERYALAHMLLAKARQFSSGIESELLSAMSASAALVPAQYTNGEAYNYLRKMPAAPADRIAEIEKMVGSDQRDPLFLDVAFHAYRKKDFESARLAASKIDNSKVQDEVEMLIQFGEVNQRLKSKDLDPAAAFDLVEKLPDSIERNLLRLSLAAIAAKTGDNKLEEELIELARASLRNHESQAAPFLALYISGKLKGRKDPRADAVFDEAAKLYNKHEAIKDPILEHPVSLPPLTLRFATNVEHVNLDFIPMFQNAVRGEEEAAILRVSDIKDERLRGLAYVSLAKAIVAKKTPTSETKPQNN